MRSLPQTPLQRNERAGGTASTTPQQRTRKWRPGRSRPASACSITVLPAPGGPAMERQGGACTAQEASLTGIGLHSRLGWCMPSPPTQSVHQRARASCHLPDASHPVPHLTLPEQYHLHVQLPASCTAHTTQCLTQQQRDASRPQHAADVVQNGVVLSGDAALHRRWSARIRHSR